ncbi:MAG: ATP-binding protein, partial [Acidiferrobacterales bacterium]
KVPNKNRAGAPANGLIAVSLGDTDPPLFAMIGNTEFFSEFTSKEIDILSNFALAYRAPKGANIIEEGDNNPMLCLIISGSVQILKNSASDKPRVITTFGSGRLIGEMSIVDDMPFSATAQAVEDSLVILIGKTELDKLEKEQPMLSIKLLQMLARLVSSRLRVTTDTLASYLARTADLTEALDQALTSAKDRSNFFANMSHEMRTPLNAIIGFSELLEEDIEDTTCVSCIDDAKRIRTSSRHLLKIIGNVLDLSRIEAGKLELYLETFPVKLLFEEIAATAEPLVTKNNNKLILDCTDSAGEMNADQTQIRQVLLNLIDNAAKFTTDGEIRFVVSCPSQDSDQVVFQVSDTGIGMSEEQIEHLFEKFSQTDASVRSKYGGTGLGLAISRSICHMVGGNLAVKSQPEDGSTFTATLPRNFTS